MALSLPNMTLPRGLIPDLGHKRLAAGAIALAALLSGCAPEQTRWLEFNWITGRSDTNTAEYGSYAQTMRITHYCTGVRGH